MYFNFNFNFCFCFLFLFLFSNANRAIEQRITNWQAGRQIEILCRHSTQATTRGSLCIVSYRIVYCICGYYDSSSSTPTHTHPYALWIFLFFCLSHRHRDLLVVATQLHMFLVCRSARSPYIYLSMDSYQALVACNTHSHSLYLVSNGQLINSTN